MRKIIIIDDREKRKELHLSETALIELKRLEEAGMLTVKTKIESNSNIENMFDSFDIIAIHRSYLANTSLFNPINDYIKSKNKHLIVFSGGISQSVILNNGRQLNINSSEFYVNRLPKFIDDFCSSEEIQSPLLQFLYGESWRLTMLLQYRYFLWAYPDIDDICNQDEELVEELQNILWDGDSNISYDEVIVEIETEKERKLNI